MNARPGPLANEVFGQRPRAQGFCAAGQRRVFTHPLGVRRQTSVFAVSRFFWLADPLSVFQLNETSKVTVKTISKDKTISFGINQRQVAYGFIGCLFGEINNNASVAAGGPKGQVLQLSGRRERRRLVHQPER